MFAVEHIVHQREDEKPGSDLNLSLRSADEVGLVAVCLVVVLDGGIKAWKPKGVS